jgi:membrane-associated phospholipid phosphatase
VYFGWHYLLDVVAGLVIGGAAVWLAALMTGRTGSLSRLPDQVTDRQAEAVPA